MIHATKGNGTQTGIMSERIKVAVRVRKPRGDLPIVCHARDDNNISLINEDKKAFRLPSTPQKNAAKEFRFDHCFDSMDSFDSDQSKIYEKLVRGYVLHTLEGYNSCILAYGQTGSGKTFTMMGEKNNEGVIPRYCRELFEIFHMCHQDDQDSDVTTDFQVKCSFFEIYNEQVIDLLSTAGPKRCKVREKYNHSTFVEGLQEIDVHDVNEIISCIHRGNENRTVKSTSMNQESSRSHAVFHISVYQKETHEKTGTAVESHSTCKLVDLAGSERLGTSLNTDGKLRQEGTSINKSLSTLGRVISLLAENTKHKHTLVPFRESTLTWILKENLGGNSNTCLIACVSPENYQESLSTLRYASLAKKVRTNATINSLSHVEQMEELKAKLRELQTMINDKRSNAAQHALEKRVEDIQKANFILEQKMARESELADQLLQATIYERDSLASMVLQIIESFNWNRTTSCKDQSNKLWEHSQFLRNSLQRDRSFFDITVQKYFS